MLELTSGKQLIPGAAGSIECQIDLPRGGASARGVALVCHPHPLFGGTMDNKVVWALAKAASEQSLAAIRFNFRGVGASTGAHDNGQGETDDAVTVLKALCDHFPGLPVFICGFSFGAAVAIRLAARSDIPTPSLLITAAPPLIYFDHEIMPQPACPWFLFHSTDDDVVPWEETRKRALELVTPPEIETLSGAGHFFHGKITDVKRLVSDRIEHTLK